MAVAIAPLGATSCGSAESLVRFDGAPHASVSPAMLNHWMRAIAGSDFRTSIATEGPTGLVSEPADYPRCLNAAKLVAPRSMFNQLRLSRRRLSGLCHELYQSVKAQALAFLISAQWTEAEAAGAGIAVTNAEIRHEFDLTRAEMFPTTRALRQYEIERRLSLADLLYQVKLTLLNGKLLPRLQPQGSPVGGDERAYIKLALQHYASLISKTVCDRGYVVQGCRGYETSSTPVAPNVLLTELVGKSPASAG